MIQQRFYLQIMENLIYALQLFAFGQRIASLTQAAAFCRLESWTDLVRFMHFFSFSVYTSDFHIQSTPPMIIMLRCALC